MIKAKHKFLLYKQFNLDIWGYLKSNLWRQKRRLPKKFKKKKKLLLQFFWPRRSFFVKKIIYYFFNNFVKYIEKLNEKKVIYTYWLKPTKFFSLYKRQYKQIKSFRLILLYYINIKHKHFKKMAIIAKKKIDSFDENFLFLLEGRLVCLVYRVGLILNMFDAIDFIKKGAVKVNNLIIYDLNYTISVMQIVGIISICKGFLILSLWRRLIRKIVYIYPPKFVYFFYTFFFFFLKRSIKRNDIMHPLKIDIYRAIGYGGYAK
jgi:hypothetical protein